MLVVPILPNLSALLSGVKTISIIASKSQSVTINSFPSFVLLMVWIALAVGLSFNAILVFVKTV